MNSENSSSERIVIPPGPVDVVLDTDTDNEMDDQFALSLALLAPERIRLKAVTAAPFFNERSSGPADGMEKSYQEILRWLDLFSTDRKIAFRGAEGYLPPGGKTPADSPSARRIVELARESARNGGKLYIISIGAPTNVASAFLLDKKIADSCILVWLGGHSFDHSTNREFNLIQDVPAVQILLNSGMQLIRVPCIHGADALTVTLAELQEKCAPLGPCGKALFDLSEKFMKKDTIRIIWDISTVAYFLVPEAFTTRTIPIPDLSDSGKWNLSDRNRPASMEVLKILRGPVFEELYRRLAVFSGK